MSYQRKLNCPICNYPKLANLNRHLTNNNNNNNKTNDLILNLTPENMTQHSRIE